MPSANHLINFLAHYQTEATANNNNPQGHTHQQDANMTCEEGNTSGNSAPGTPAAEEPRELISSAPSNLLVTFLEYCSIVMQVSSISETTCIFY